MKTIATYGLRLPQIRVNIFSVMIYICIITFLVFSAVNVKFQSLRTGYDINILAKKNQKLSIQVQKLRIERSKLIDRKRLYKEGKSLGLTLPEANKVYHVE